MTSDAKAPSTEGGIWVGALCYRNARGASGSAGNTFEMSSAAKAHIAASFLSRRPISLFNTPECFLPSRNGRPARPAAARLPSPQGNVSREK